MISSSKSASKAASSLKARTNKILSLLEARYPNPKCELTFMTPFQLLVSVVLSAQATDKSVNLATAPLYSKAFGPKEILDLGEKEFLSKIKSIGLAPTKAKNVLKLTKIIVEKFSGQVPRAREDLEALPGVGRKTASVVLGEIYGEPTLAVDTHVFRVSKRLGFHAEPTPEKAEKKLLELIDPKWLPKAHHWFILLGRYICTARSPKCLDCPVSSLCPSKSI